MKRRWPNFWATSNFPEVAKNHKDDIVTFCYNIKFPGGHKIQEPHGIEY
jgi:hypothetical protein